MFVRATRRAVLVAAATAILVPALVSAQALEKKKVTIAVGGKNLLYYLPLTIAEQKGLLQGRRARRRDRRLRRRREGAAGRRGRQRGRRVGRLRAHHQHAGQGPVDARLRAAGARAADRAGRQHQDDAELQVRGGPEGQEDRRFRARLVDQHHGQLCAREVRSEAERRIFHRCRRFAGRGRGDAFRADRCDLQPRSGDDDAGAEQRHQDHFGHARRGRGGQGLRRSDAGGDAVRAGGLSRKEPEHARRR